MAGATQRNVIAPALQHLRQTHGAGLVSVNDHRLIAVFPRIAVGTGVDGLTVEFLKPRQLRQAIDGTRSEQQFLTGDFPAAGELD